MGKIAGWVIKLTPLGVFSLIGYVIAKEGLETLYQLKEYVIAVLVALFLHALVILPLVAYLIGRFNPYTYFIKVREAVLVAFSTASSSATLPVSIEVSETKGGVKKESAGFILPLGATVNMDGTALYEAIAVMFIANSFGVELGFTEQIVIFVTATFASIGAAGIPGAGLVMMTMILSAVGLPLEAIGLIAAVDRILDMFRTSINVLEIFGVYSGYLGTYLNDLGAVGLASVGLHIHYAVSLFAPGHESGFKHDLVADHLYRDTGGDDKLHQRIYTLKERIPALVHKLFEALQIHRAAALFHGGDYIVYQRTHPPPFTASTKARTFAASFFPLLLSTPLLTSKP